MYAYNTKGEGRALLFEKSRERPADVPVPYQRDSQVLRLTAPFGYPILDRRRCLGQTDSSGISSSSLDDAYIHFVINGGSLRVRTGSGYDRSAARVGP